MRPNLTNFFIDVLFLQRLINQNEPPRFPAESFLCGPRSPNIPLAQRQYSKLATALVILHEDSSAVLGFHRYPYTYVEFCV